MFGPLKGSCRAEGEEKITGADIICFCHVDLTSGLTHCGPVRYACQVYLHTCSDTMRARPPPTRTDTHVKRRGDELRARRDQRSTGHTPTQSCAQTDACGELTFSHHFPIIFPSFPSSRCRDLHSLIVFPAHAQHSAENRTCARVEATVQQWRNAFLYVRMHAPLSLGGCNMDVTGCAHASCCCTFA